ncbi:MAG: TolC family protein [Planctomycetes bacterium]|nr:TolC family protein [Planctomycetota bacterium]
MCCWLALAAGCAADTADFAEPELDAALLAAAGHHLRQSGEVDAALPPGIDVADGVDADEAVAIALWRNPDFAATLAEVGVSRALLAESGLLQNPLLSIYFPVGPKQLEFTVTWPIEALLRRSGRIAAARADCEQVAARLLQQGLDLARDVRLAMIDRDLAAERGRIAARAAEISDGLAVAAGSRLAAGDLSAADAELARVDAAAAARERVRRVAELAGATERLCGLLAYRPAASVRFVSAATAAPPTAPTQPLDELVALALTARPDLHAAELGLAGASERAGLAEWQAARLSAIADANAKGKEGFEIGPGLLAELPLFQRGPIDSRTAEVALALRRRDAIARRVADEVAVARLALQQALRLVELDEREVLPVLTARVEQLRRQVAAGQEAEFATLPAEAALLRAEADHGDALAACRRARVELERAVGCRLPPPGGPER